MNVNAQQRLLDALAAANLLHQNIQGQTEDRFRADPWFRSAVERQLEIIGEALNHVRREQPAVIEQFPTIHEWVALRNVLSHLYDRVDLDLVWDAIDVDLLPLITTLQTLIESSSETRR